MVVRFDLFDQVFQFITSEPEGPDSIAIGGK